MPLEQNTSCDEAGEPGPLLKLVVSGRLLDKGRQTFLHIYLPGAFDTLRPQIANGNSGETSGPAANNEHTYTQQRQYRFHHICHAMQHVPTVLDSNLFGTAPRTIIEFKNDNSPCNAVLLPTTCLRDDVFGAAKIFAKYDITIREQS
jgi:hypothetical protein